VAAAVAAVGVVAAMVSMEVPHHQHPYSAIVERRMKTTSTMVVAIASESLLRCESAVLSVLVVRLNEIRVVVAVLNHRADSAARRYSTTAQAVLI